MKEFDQIVLLTGKEMEVRQRDDKKLRVSETVMSRLTRVLGTICVGMSRLVAETARFPRPDAHRVLAYWIPAEGRAQR